MKQKLFLLFIGLFISFFNYAQVANQPNDIEVCDDNNDGFAEFDLTVVEVEVLGNQNSNDFVITYYETQVDADNGSNSISSFFTNTTPSIQIIYIRLEELELVIMLRQVLIFM